MSSAVATVLRRLADTYVDSVLLLAATRAMQEVEGVTWATAVMATPANLEALEGQGVAGPELDGAAANDLVLAVRAGDAAAADRALDGGASAVRGERSGARPPGPAPAARDLALAARELPGANIAIVSVPGAYAALEAHKALSAGLDVLLFSDNVPVDEEVELKRRAAEVGHLVMGPGAGTAVLGGCGLGFANRVRPGRVGVVAAAGTGAQEVMSLLDQWGEGVSQVIGVGGRDLSSAVGGAMATLAVQALDADPATEVILLVSKPPAPDVARRVVSAAAATPLVAGMVGWPAGTALAGAAAVRSTLEGAALATLEVLGQPPPRPDSAWPTSVRRAIEYLPPPRTLVRGLYSGGTLCYEALSLLQPALGPVWSNTPLDPRYRVPAPAGAHVCLDLGEEEYTQGRPHPMIDPEARLDELEALRTAGDVAAVVLDVVLGYGAHPDPAAVLAPVCAELTGPGGLCVVVYVLGTEGDPQGLARQRAVLVEAGCIVAPTGARAALTAAAIATRDPMLVEQTVP